MKTEEFKRVYNETRNGANCFYRHPLARNVAYSDGIRDLAETGCWWLLDIWATELPAVFKKHPHMGGQYILKAKVAKGKVKLWAEAGDDLPPVWKRSNIWTDLPEGEWVFMMVDECEDPTPYRILLLTEY